MARAGQQRSGDQPTTAQLKHDIDSGQTGDKVAFPDFAAAPLGTDDEAAGTPPSPEAIALARAQERAPVTPPRSRFGGYRFAGIEGWSIAALGGGIVVVVGLLAAWFMG